MQGYVTLALCQQKYVDMAVNLAKSIRYHDKKRPVCLIHDEKVSLLNDQRAVFDDCVLLPTQDGYVGCTNKIRIYDASPYDENMYVDSDCLMVKNNIDSYWKRAADHGYFAITGEKRASGFWNAMDITKVCEKLFIPYIVSMNGGVFYFKKGAEAQKLFEKVDWLYKNHRDDLSNIHQSRAGQYADEPLFGTAMGIFGLAPLDSVPSRDAWMVSTWRASRCQIDPESGHSSLRKPSKYWFGIAFLPRAWTEHSPTFFHFISLKPAGQYKRAVAFFDEAYALGRKSG